MDKYRGYTSDAIRAIEYAEKKKIKIINCSFGSNDENPALMEAMKNSGILYVCAAGNDGKNIDENPFYPASFKLPNVVSVGSINSEGKISDFSNYGTGVDLLAPGEEILSTIPGEEYYSFSGTSMSAAYVTGAAALLQSHEPDLSAAEIAERLISTVRKYQDYESKSESGGIIDVYAILTNDVAPVSEEPLFEASEELNSQEADINTFAADDDVAVVSVAGEIKPIVAQGIHYGESGVNPASGNFSFSVTDFNDTAPGGNFVFQRYYNSLDQNKEKAFGCRWSSMLDSRVYDPKANGKQVTVIMPNRSSHIFKLSNGIYSSNTTRNTLIKDSDSQFTLKTRDNEQYVFRARSGGNAKVYKLLLIMDKTGSVVTQIVYDSTYSLISQILDSAGRAYKIEYSNVLGQGFNVSSITDPYGRSTRYNYVSIRDSWGILYSSVDIMGNKTVMNYSQMDYTSSTGNELPNVDTYITHINQYENDNSQNVLYIEYDLKSYSPDYGKVKSYTDAYGETYTYDYNYMNTVVTWQDSGCYRTEYYDSYMYVYKTDYNSSLNMQIITERRYYRPDGKNYGEVIQEMSENIVDITTYIREPSTGNVTQVVNPDGSTKLYWYDANNNMIGSLDEENNCTLYVYNTKNMLLKKAYYVLKGFPDIPDKKILTLTLTRMRINL